MALVTKEQRFESEKNERVSAWEKLKIIPEYIEDYNRCRLHTKKTKMLSANEIKRIINHWGFWPLANPQNKNSNAAFFFNFSTYNQDVSRFESPIDWEGFDRFYIQDGILHDPNGYPCEEDKVDSVISLKIRIDYPVEILVKEFRSSVKAFQKMLQIKKSNTRSHDHLEYLVSCLIKRGLEDTEIYDRLLPKNIKALKHEHERKKAAIKAIRDRIKKYKKV